MGKASHTDTKTPHFHLLGTDHLLQSVQLLQNHTTVSQDFLSVSCKRSALTGTTKKRQPHFLFQLLDDMTELGLGNKHGPGGPADRTILCYGRKVPQIVRIHKGLLVLQSTPVL